MVARTHANTTGPEASIPDEVHALTPSIEVVERALPWSPIPADANRTAFLDVIQQEGSVPQCSLLLLVASRFPAGTTPAVCLAWRLLFTGVARVEVEPLLATQETIMPLPDDRTKATWKMAPSRGVARLAAQPFPGLSRATLEHYVIRTLHGLCYQIIATEYDCTPLTGAEAEAALAIYGRLVDGLLAQARRSPRW